MKQPLFHDAPRQHPDEITIDHKTGLIHRKNHAPVELVGPTTGSEYEELKKKEKQNAKAMAHMRRQMAAFFQCTQCKQKFSGKYARIKWLNLDGVLAETLVCKDAKCDAPVIMIEDPLNLRTIPGRVQ